MVGLNSLSIGGQCDWIVSHAGEPLPILFRVVELVFCAIFSIELTARIIAYGPSFFCCANWKWNSFDFFIVFLQLFEEFINLCTDSPALAWFASHFNIMRVLKVLRLVRILRLFRVLRFLKELRQLVWSISCSLRALGWTLFLLSAILYLVGIYVTQMVADVATDTPAIMQEDGAVLLKYFGSLPRSILSLYQAFLGGVDWNDIVVPLHMKVSPTLTFVMISYVAFVSFALMNVVTGVFVEAALRGAKNEQDSELRLRVRDIFKSLDNNEDQSISREEFMAAAADPQMEIFFKKIDMDIDEAHILFELLSQHSQQGETDMEEFINQCIRFRGPAKGADFAMYVDLTQKTWQWQKEQIACIAERQETLLNILSTGQSRSDSPGISPKHESEGALDDESDTKPQAVTDPFGPPRFQSWWDGRDRKITYRQRISQHSDTFETELVHAVEDAAAVTKERVVKARGAAAAGAAAVAARVGKSLPFGTSNAVKRRVRPKVDGNISSNPNLSETCQDASQKRLKSDTVTGDGVASKAVRPHVKFPGVVPYRKPLTELYHMRGTSEKKGDLHL